MRYQGRRIGDIIFNDPTRNLQLLGAMAAWLRAGYALIFDPFVWNWPIASAFFYYFPPWSWALTLFAAGTVQWWAAGTRRWRVKYWVATAQLCLVVYGLAITILTGQVGGQGIPLAIVLGIIQAQIAVRSLHDQELNGTDRRS